MDDFARDLYPQITALRRYAMALAGNPTEADDLVQESLKRAIVYARNGGEIRNVRAFLFTVLHNAWVNDLQKKQTRPQVDIEDVASQLSIEGNQQHRVELTALLRALRELPDDQRRVVLLVCLEGFAYREVAEMTGVPIGTVMSRLSRARKALMAKMNEQDMTPRVARVQ